MKKALKILGITLASLIAVVLLVVFTAIYVVFTPERLTPVVNRVADSLVVTEHHLDEVSLTFFKTFPCFGLEIDGLYILNPMEGAQSDTLLAVPEILLSLDVMQYLDSQRLDILEVNLPDVVLNAYINKDGQTNFEIDSLLRLPKDTVKDTTATILPFDIRLHRLSLSTRQLSFVDDKDSLRFENLSLNISTVASMDSTMSSIHAEVEELQLGWDGLTVDVTGDVQIEDQIRMDLQVQTNEWRISHLLHLLPQQYAGLMPKEVVVDGDLSLQAHVYGAYDSLTYPLVDAHLLIDDAAGHYDKKVLPYEFDKLAVDVSAHANLNQKERTSVTINKVYARTGETSVEVTGTATEILQRGKKIALGNPLCEVKAQLQVSLPDAEYWVKSDSVRNQLHGTLQGTVTAQSRLEDITKLKPNKIKVQGNLSLDDVDVIWKDSTLCQAQNLTIDFTAPKEGITNPDIFSWYCTIGMDDVHAQLLSSNLDAKLNEGKLNAWVEIDKKDTTHLPTLSAGFDLDDVSATMDTMSFHAKGPKGQLTFSSTRRDHTKPKANLSFSAQALDAKTGREAYINTKEVKIEANARYNKDADKLLLKWNPKLKFAMHDAHVNLVKVGTPIAIPQIKLAYSNRTFTIDTSRIVIANSDFSLAGDIHNMGKWLQHEDTLWGQLRFTSAQTDITELLGIVNHFNHTAGLLQKDTTATKETAQSDTAAKPFMVPDMVNLTLQTLIRKAIWNDEVLENVGGRLYVQDGQVVLEEMGFMCEAAKMILTAMYKTPRENHLFVGLDFHLLDIDLHHLIKMIPQLDSVVPMLSEFQGRAEFHIALETYLTSRYQPKKSTIRGACSVEGKDLVLLDGATFEKISKILMFSPKTKNVIDSISVQMALVKDQVTVYPFCISIDNYMAAVGGKHYMDMNFDYHASLLKPFYIGVDVSGNIDNLDIKPAKCRYAQDFRPIIHKDTETSSAVLSKMISESLKKGLKQRMAEYQGPVDEYGNPAPEPPVVEEKSKKSNKKTTQSK